MIRDAGAAGESHPAVDDQRLAVVPVIGAVERVPMNGPKPGELAAAGLQNFENVRAEGRRSDGVQQEFHGDSAARLLGECFRESPPHPAIPEDVLLHGDGHAGRLDRLQHGRIELVAVVVKRHPISVHERHSGGPGHGGS